MRRGWKAWFLAIVATFAFAPGAAAQARSPSKGTVHYRHIGGTLYRSFIRSLGHEGRAFMEVAGPALLPASAIPTAVSAFMRCRFTIALALGASPAQTAPVMAKPVLFAIAADAVRLQ
jgi:hypothetical protein